jgi:hypothetical protein
MRRGPLLTPYGMQAVFALMMAVAALAFAAFLALT